MDILLPKIQDYLRGRLTWVRRSDICLIPHPGVIQDGAGFPYIGIKDGNVTNHELSGDELEQEMPVEIYIYDRLGRSEKEILEIHTKAKTITALLREENFSETVAGVEPTSEMAVTLLYTRNGLVIRKGLRFLYERRS